MRVQFVLAGGKAQSSLRRQSMMNVRMTEKGHKQGHPGCALCERWLPYTVSQLFEGFPAKQKGVPVDNDFCRSIPADCAVELELLSVCRVSQPLAITHYA